MHATTSMNSIPVIATASSRLQADVMIIRLRRAGIPIGHISAISPASTLPNSVAVWLTLWRRAVLKLGQDTLMAAGPMRRWLRKAGDKAISPAKMLSEAGFDRMATKQAEEHLRQGETLVCVHAKDEEGVAIAWHIFKHAKADFIALPTRPLNPSTGSAAIPMVYPDLELVPMPA
jgi:hypothetical protein